MTTQAQIEKLNSSDRLPKGVRITVEPNRGKRVVAAICGQRRDGIHRYTLSHGQAVWNWWWTAEEAAADLGVEL